MIYSLLIWTVIAGDRYVTNHDWRPIGEFTFSYGDIQGENSGKAKCEEAARQLGIKPDRYRCVRNK